MDADRRNPTRPLRGPGRGIGPRLGRSLGLGLAALALTSCVSLGRTEPAQEYYILGADTPRAAPEPAPAPAAADADGAIGVTVGLRRLKLASYLASPLLVVRSGPNQVDFREFRRWGEPLGDGINRVVAGRLMARGLGDVAVAPWAVRARLDYLVQLDVERFEGVAPDGGDGNGGVHLLATWEIIRPADGVVLTRGTTDHRASGWTVGDYPALVRLLEDGLDVLSAQLASAVAALGRPSESSGIDRAPPASP